MLRKFVCVLIVFCFVNVGNADDAQVKKKSPSAVIQAASVNVKSGYSEGSGTIITHEVQLEKGSKDTEIVNFILTAAHVVDDLRSVRTVITEDGSERKVIEFKDASIVKEYRQKGRRVGESKMDCKVIAYSDADHGDDLACLMVRKFKYEDTDVTTQFEKDNIVEVGEPLLHCGSLLGQMGANSMTNGIMSQRGRVYNGKVYDQTTVSAFPGSSGGGVYIVVSGEPKYVGMITRGAGETFNLMVPMRRITKWAKDLNVSWLIDPSVPVPTMEEILELPIEKHIGGAKQSRLAAGDQEDEEGKEFIFLDGEHAKECWWKNIIKNL